MGMKQLFFRIVAALGDGAVKTLQDFEDDPLSPQNSPTASLELMDPMTVDPVTHDFNSLPLGGADQLGFDEER